MLRTHTHGDVVRLEMSTWRSRAIRFSVSAYLVRGVLVDCGFAGVGDEVEAMLRQLRPRGVVLTHQHEDHAGNVERVAQLGLPVAAARATLDALRAPGPIGFYRWWTWGSMPPLATPPAHFAPDDLRLVPTPGHSADHHALWDPHERTLFGGDLFLGVKVRVAHEWEDLPTLARSLRRAAALEPRRLFDAHRGEVPNPVSALLAKADWLDATVARIDRHLADGWPDEAISREVLGREDLVSAFSRFEYSRRSFVRSVRRVRDAQRGTRDAG